MMAVRARELRASGVDVITLGAGEPDFDTPEYIKQAAVNAIAAGDTKYTPVDGTPDLKKAIINKFTSENNLKYEPAQILASCGAKHSIYNLFQAAVEPGDEVILPAPYWVSYPDMVKLAGGNSVVIETTQEQNFKITADQLEEKINSKTKVLVLNSPSNPSGAVYSKKELESLAEVLLKHPQIIVASDDIYEHIIFDNCIFQNILNVCPQLSERTVVINGVSKAFSMTGWRIGYAAGPLELIAAMKCVQSQSTSCPSSISQAAAAEALKAGTSKLTKMLQAFNERLKVTHSELNKLPGIDCFLPQGTFYCFPNVNTAIEGIDGVNDDVEFSQFLLEKHHVAVVPGSAFGLTGHVRISFATDIETIKTALSRIGKALSKTKSE